MIPARARAAKIDMHEGAVILGGRIRGEPALEGLRKVMFDELHEPVRIAKINIAVSI